MSQKPPTLLRDRHQTCLLGAQGDRSVAGKPSDMLGAHRVWFERACGCHEPFRGPRHAVRQSMEPPATRQPRMVRPRGCNAEASSIPFFLTLHEYGHLLGLGDTY